MYKKEFEIRWSDLDANGHLANSSYLNFMSHARMAFMLENGLGLEELKRHQIGPVVFDEHIFYFRELFIGDPVTVTLELKGLSEDGTFFEFLHNFYNSKGKNCARCVMLGSWINLKTRKLAPVPMDIYQKLKRLPKTSDFRILTREDTRAHGVIPEDLQ